MFKSERNKQYLSKARIPRKFHHRETRRSVVRLLDDTARPPGGYSEQRKMQKIGNDGIGNVLWFTIYQNLRT